MELKEGMLWKDITGYEGYYQISNTGVVKSMKRYSNCCYGKQRLLKEKIIVPSQDKNGYLRIMLSINGIKKRYYIHELVAREFIKGYSDNIIIHHIDYDNQNNNFENLYLCDRSEHITIHNKTDRLIKYFYEKGLIEFKNGEYLIKEQYEANKYVIGE